MAQTLFSPSWYRVAKLRPALRKQVVIYRHNYRNQPWHVIEERSSDQHHRFRPGAYFILGLMDGTRTVDDIWRAGLDHLADDAPSQDEMIGLLAQLHFADLLKTDSSPEANDLFMRYEMIERQRWLTRLSAPFAWRVPLLDPDKMLDYLLPAARWVFSPWGLGLWLIVVGIGVAEAATNWGHITDGLSARVLDPWNLLALAIAYPLLKLLHELAHALAVKAWGGQVHDVGVMFIMFMPIPYVDASASSGFASKWRRALVDGAGILVELLIASIALMLWLDAENDMLKSVLFNLMLIGTVSTLLFNGNPLLKFDGYYILSDIIEIPNLAQRAQRYLSYLFKRYLWGIKSARSPVTADGERFWFLLYGPMAAVYRIFLTFSIALFLASEYLLVGLLLAGWSLLLMGIVPVIRLVTSLANDPELRHRRPRLIGSIASLAAAVIGLLFFLPAPYSTVAEAVTVVPENRQVRAAAEGVVVNLLASPGSAVTPGTPLVVMADPTVEAEAKVLQAQVAALAARLAATEFNKVVDSNIIRAELKAVREDLARVSERQAEQTISSTAAGAFLVPLAADLPGRYLQRGAILGFVHDPHEAIIRAVVDQTGMGNIQRGVSGIEIWQVGQQTRPMPATMLRIVPAGHNELPHKALAVEGGGVIPLDPRTPEQLRTTYNVFQVDLRPGADYNVTFLGQRYYVRFRHEPQPIGMQLYDRLRQLLLDRFGV